MLQFDEVHLRLSVKSHKCHSESNENSKEKAIQTQLTLLEMSWEKRHLSGMREFWHHKYEKIETLLKIKDFCLLGGKLDGSCFRKLLIRLGQRILKMNENGRGILDS